MVEIKAYTDGACSGNPGPGGWGVYWTEVKNGNTNVEEFYGSSIETTNQRMELTAAIVALKTLKEKNEKSITIFTDSKYDINGITSWVKNWQKNGWKNSKGKIVENLDLWQELYNLSKTSTVCWEWVKGHVGHQGNEKADELAVKGRDEVKEV